MVRGPKSEVQNPKSKSQGAKSKGEYVGRWTVDLEPRTTDHGPSDHKTMSIAILCDIGSTFTKVVAIDCEEATVLAVGAAPTTIDRDVGDGLRHAVAQVEEQIGPVFSRADLRLACSSAAGGLRMVAIGLVPNLTAEAAKWAALGAGAKLLQTLSFKLSEREIAAIDGTAVDIILLAGGIDGGNSDTILHNARLLARSDLTAPIIVAGNKVVQDEVADILCRAGKDVRVVDNVMPQLETVNIEPARGAIRKLFLEKIVIAKGLDRIQDLIDGVVMPTPSAVMESARLLSRGDGRNKGWGELIVVDVGGATTDVHSMASGSPTLPGVVRKGLVEPWDKRTVEGDLGMRYSAAGLMAAIEEADLLRIGVQLDKEGRFTITEMERFVAMISQESDRICTSEREIVLESIIARAAIETAVTRHAGKLNHTFTPHGKMTIQRGKDLTGVRRIIGTGGVLVRHRSPHCVLAGAVRHPDQADILTPTEGRLYLDKDYIIAAAGLLAKPMPQTAFKLLNQYVTEIYQEERC